MISVMYFINYFHLLLFIFALKKLSTFDIKSLLTEKYKNVTLITD
jgi:hypothetical protein